MASAKKNNKVEIKKKWTERETIKFVELYEVEEVLWNIKLNEYKNKDARNAAINRIIRNLNIPGLTIQDVNTKINNIRSTYSQEKSKITKSTTTGSGADDIYVPSLVWFEIADRFLSGVIKSRKTFQNVVDSNDLPANPSPDIPPSYSPDIPAMPSPDIPATPSPDIPIYPSQDIVANSSPDLTAIPSTSTSDNSHFVAPSNRKRTKKTLPPHITKSIETLQSIKDQALNSREVEDEFTYFGKNVASQLRQLPLVDALELQCEIFNLIKMRRKSNIPEEASSSLNESHYTIEIPEHMFILQQASETNHIVQNEVQDVEENTLLEQAIQSIGGLSQAQKE